MTKKIGNSSQEITLKITLADTPVSRENGVRLRLSHRQLLGTHHWGVIPARFAETAERLCSYLHLCQVRILQRRHGGSSVAESFSSKPTSELWIIDDSLNFFWKYSRWYTNSDIKKMGKENESKSSTKVIMCNINILIEIIWKLVLWG